jgi:hypothetical protein
VNDPFPDGHCRHARVAIPDGTGLALTAEGSKSRWGWVARVSNGLVHV